MYILDLDLDLTLQVDRGRTGGASAAAQDGTKVHVRHNRNRK